MWEESELLASNSGATKKVFVGGYTGRPLDEVVHVSRRMGRGFKFHGKEKAKGSQHVDRLSPGRHRRSRRVRRKDIAGGGGGERKLGRWQLWGGVRGARNFLRATRPRRSQGECTKAEATWRWDKWRAGTEHTTRGSCGRRPQRRGKAGRMVDKATRRQGLEGKFKAVMRGIRESERARQGYVDPISLCRRERRTSRVGIQHATTGSSKETELGLATTKAMEGTRERCPAYAAAVADPRSALAAAVEEACPAAAAMEEACPAAAAGENAGPAAVAAVKDSYPAAAAVKKPGSAAAAAVEEACPAAAAIEEACPAAAAVEEACPAAAAAK